MKCYSTNSEDFSYNELSDAISDAFNNDPDITVGDIITIEEGDAVLWKAGDFADSDPVGALAERSYDEAGAYADDWPGCSKEQEADLMQRVEVVVNQWADDHGLQPNFYRVDNVKEIRVKITSAAGDYKIC